MFDREQLETFASVLEYGSFDRAAKLLNVTRGAVSQRMRALEEVVGSVLVLRERPVRATSRGEVLLRHVKALRMLEGSVLHELRDGAQDAAALRVAIAVNSDSLSGWFGTVLDRLLEWRHIALEIISDDQDHTFARLSRGEVLGCISTESRPMPGYVAECLGCMRYRCLARPELVRSCFPQGLDVASILKAPAILFDRKDSLHDQFLENLFGFRIERYPRHYIPSPSALQQAVRAGRGYGMVPVRRDGDENLREWNLVDLAPGHHMDVTLYWHHWNSELSVAHDITALVTAEARRELLAAENAGRVDSTGHSPSKRSR